MTNEVWIGLVPAAGKGLRLNLPYPKELYPIIRNNRYKPVSQFILEQIVHAGVGHVVIVINETKHQLVGYFGSGQRFGCDISYVVQEYQESLPRSTSPGLADALDAAYHLTRGKTVFFGMPDTIIQPTNVFSLAIPLLDTYDVVMCLFPTLNPQKFGMIRHDPSGKVYEIIDKPAMTDLKTMWGSIIWKSVFTDYLHEKITKHHLFDFATIMNQAISDGINFGGVTIEGGEFIDLGTYEEIMEMDKRLREREED
jgi:dTDP-glucose pyrophosphorylase